MNLIFTLILPDILSKKELIKQKKIEISVENKRINTSGKNWDVCLYKLNSSL